MEISRAARFQSSNPGRECQQVGTAHYLRQDPANIHEPTWAIIGNQGDSQCYLGVRDKVDVIQRVLGARIQEQTLPIRLIPSYLVGGVSDGQLNGTDRMRFSLIGREIAKDSLTLHLSGSDVKGVIAVVACDKPPVGTLAAIAEHNQPAIIMSDGSIRPGKDPRSQNPIDIVTCFQAAGNPDDARRSELALHACPGYGSCGGLFTYNTMQSFIGALGMEPLHMVSPASEDERRITQFPYQLVSYLEKLTSLGIKPRDIITPASLRNAVTVAMALGGSTNVVLHAPEIARAAGIKFWKDVMTQKQFNQLSREVPVLTDVRPFGQYSMVDIDAVGGLQVVVKQLLDKGLLDGNCITCTGETLSDQVKGLNTADPDGDVIYSIDTPYKPTGGLRILKGNLAPKGGAVIKIAGVEGGIDDKGRFKGKARTFNSEKALLEALERIPDVFEDKDIVVIRYEGPKGAPGMPEMLDPTSRITALCRNKGITIALMTDARFSGGSVGLVIGHVAPEAYDGGPIALVQKGDEIVVDLNQDSIDCTELKDKKVRNKREKAWKKAAKENDGEHPSVKALDNSLLFRMRNDAALPLEGAGWSTIKGQPIRISR